ncbi:MAG: glycosyltransferase [Candidatus Nanopelagicales bacterium]
MINRAGSELATSELMHEFTRRGDEVALFTLFPGPVSDELAQQGFPVFGIRDLPAVREWCPDVGHIHHWPLSYILADAGLQIPSVYGFLGRFPPIENPPALTTVAPWYAVSEVGYNHFRQVSGWSTAPSTVIGNWWDDSIDLPSARDRVSELQNVMVVSNHFPASQLEMLRALGKAEEFTVTKIGLPENPQPVDTTLLNDADAIVTIGRTAITGLALGIPVLVWDHFGCDGWVTDGNFTELARHNFSGRATQRKLTDPDLAELFRYLPQVKSDEAREWARTQRSLSSSAERISALHTSAVELGAAVDWSQPSNERRVLADYAVQAGVLAAANIEHARTIRRLRRRVEKLKDADKAQQRSLGVWNRTSDGRARLRAWIRD